MEGRDPPKKEFRPPRWNSPLWIAPVMLLMLWLWQSALVQLTYKTIPYSEFKEHLARGEVMEAVVKDTVIEGLAQPRAQPSASSDASATNTPATQASAAPGKRFYFRTVRVDDPNLVAQLEEAHVKFHGVRPSFMSQF